MEPVAASTPAAVRASAAAPSGAPAKPPSATLTGPSTSPGETASSAATASTAADCPTATATAGAAGAAAAAAASSPEEQLQALEAKMGKWKEAVAAQLTDAARKNKKLREELRVVREEKETALAALRVQLAEEFQERTVMQREELATLTAQTAALREEMKTMSAAHMTELQTTRLKLRDVIQVEVETDFKRREEQWEKEKAQLQARTEAKESEKAQAEHECDVLRLRLTRLGAQYDELASLLQPEGSPVAPMRVLDAESGAEDSGTDGSAGHPLLAPASNGSGSTNAQSGNAVARQQTAVAAAHAKQLETIKAELQSKEQQARFMLDRAKQEHEAEKMELLRELQLREEELKVAHTLLKQVQVESSRHLERVSSAQTERQALEQRYAAKVSALSQELAQRIRTVDETQQTNQRLQEQLKAAQQQVATLEEESTMREAAFHSLMLSEDNKRVVMDLQRAVQAARDEAEDWKMQYYASLSPAPAASGASSPPAGTDPRSSAQAPSSPTSGAEHAFGTRATPAAAASAQTRNDQLAAREAQLETQEAQLARKAALLEAAEAKLNDMRRSMASQASLLLQQQQQVLASGTGSGGGAKSRRARRAGDDEGDMFVDGADAERNEGFDDDMADTSPFISTAASVLPVAMHGSLRMLEAQRRRLNLPGTCGLCAFCFTGGGTSGTPRRLRRNAVIGIVAFMMVLMLVSGLRIIS